MSGNNTERKSRPKKVINTMRINKVGFLASIAFVTATAWILTYQFSNVWGNLEASFIWSVPTFVTSHIILHRKINKVHETVKENNSNDNRSGRTTEAESG